MGQYCSVFAKIIAVTRALISFTQSNPTSYIATVYIPCQWFQEAGNWKWRLHIYYI